MGNGKLLHIRNFACLLIFSPLPTPHSPLPTPHSSLPIAYKKISLNFASHSGSWRILMVSGT
jgi:hypothetical protein